MRLTTSEGVRDLTKEGSGLTTTCTDTITTFQQIKDQIESFVQARDWAQHHNPKNLSMSIAIEAAELMEIFQWTPSELAPTITESEEFTHLQEELADVLIYCMQLANRLEIDVASAIRAKMEKNERRFPAVKPQQ